MVLVEVTADSGPQGLGFSYASAAAAELIRQMLAGIVVGPPIFAPLLVCIVGVLGLFASLLRREVLRYPSAGADGPGPLPPLAFAGHLRAAREGGIRGLTPPSPRGKGNGGSGLLPGLESGVAQGRFQQGMALTAAGLAILSGGEAYFEHLRGSFNQRLMWTPVWLTPPMVTAAVGALKSPRVARDVLPIAPWIDQLAAKPVLDGLRFEEMPPNDVAWEWGLAGLDQTARALFGGAFADPEADQQDRVLEAIRAGNPAPTDCATTL